ncbi:MAG TPA: hypothetical protein VFZ61_08275 [Polyangiales bacterium]
MTKLGDEARPKRAHAGVRAWMARARSCPFAFLFALLACAPSAFEKFSGPAQKPEPEEEGGASETRPGRPSALEAGLDGGEEPEAGAPDSGDGPSDVCQPGDTECVSATSERSCNASGQWDTPVDCPNACVGGRCGGSCTPDTTQCVSATQLQTCNANAEWDAAEACQFACVGERCAGECVPGSRSCGAENTPRVCNDAGSWSNEAACSGATPVCQATGICRCRTGHRRCHGAQPQVCNALGQWSDTGAPCANCTDEGQCPSEGCSPERAKQCGDFCGCGCVNDECSGGFSHTGDGCTNERRTACANAGCRCVDGACSGGMCDGTGCTEGKKAECKRLFGAQCGCALGECVGTCVPQP